MHFAACCCCMFAAAAVAAVNVKVKAFVAAAPTFIFQQLKI